MWPCGPSRGPVSSPVVPKVPEQEGNLSAGGVPLTTPGDSCIPAGLQPPRHTSPALGRSRPAGRGAVLHRCSLLWERQPLHQPPLRAQPGARAGVHVPPGPALPQDRLLQHPPDRGRGAVGVGGAPSAAGGWPHTLTHVQPDTGPETRTQEGPPRRG